MPGPFAWPPFVRRAAGRLFCEGAADGDDCPGTNIEALLRNFVDPWEREPDDTHVSGAAAGASGNIAGACGNICDEVADTTGTGLSGGFSMADGIVEDVAAAATGAVDGDDTGGADGASGSTEGINSSAAPDVANVAESPMPAWPDEDASVPASPISRASTADADGAEVSAGAALTAACGLARTSCFKAAEADGADAVDKDGAGTGVDSACCFAFGAACRAAPWVVCPGAVDSRFSDFLTMLSKA